jgi:hypothetical protein
MGLKEERRDGYQERDAQASSRVICLLPLRGSSRRRDLHAVAGDARTGLLCGDLPGDLPSGRLQASWEASWGGRVIARLLFDGWGRTPCLGNNAWLSTR